MKISYLQLFLDELLSSVCHRLFIVNINLIICRWFHQVSVSLNRRPLITCLLYLELVCNCYYSFFLKIHFIINLATLYYASLYVCSFLCTVLFILPAYSAIIQRHFASCIATIRHWLLIIPALETAVDHSVQFLALDATLLLSGPVLHLNWLG